MSLPTTVALRRFLRQNVLGLVAIVIALSGTAYAATQLPANSVGSKQIKKNAIIGSKVRDGSLTGADLKLSSLGKVPSARRADEAKNATMASNALALDGLLASNLQHRVGGTCPTNEAIGQINADGSVACRVFSQSAGTSGFVIDASGGPVEVVEGSDTPIPLIGATTWVAKPNEIGILLLETKVKVATNRENLSPPENELCGVWVTIYDNGHFSRSSGAWAEAQQAGAETLTVKLGESGLSPIGVIEPGVSHTITASGRAYDGGCQEGVAIQAVRVVVLPIGG